MFENFSAVAIGVIGDSMKWCLRLRDPEIRPEHLLLALLENHTLFGQLAESNDISADTIISVISASNQTATPASDSALPPLRFAPNTKAALSGAQKIRQEMGHKLLLPDHIALSLVTSEESDIRAILEQLELDVTTIAARLRAEISPSFKRLDLKRAHEDPMQILTEIYQRSDEDLKPLISGMMHGLNKT